MSTTTAVPTGLFSRPSMRRILGLAKTNITVIVRNRLTLSYALILPLLPLALLLLSERGDVTAGLANLSTVLLMALLFPVYYNVLSMVVTRRDELVLKRLRTGEARDAEILVATALPGVVITLLVATLAVPLAMAAGLEAPANPLLLVVGVLLASLAFSALAVWTAAWTRNAEAAQMTSLPVIVLATIGLMRPAFPDSVYDWLVISPGAALGDLLKAGWFGQSTGLDSSASLSWAATWTEALPVLGVLLAWAAVAMFLAQRSMRWEPRT